MTSATHCDARKYHKAARETAAGGQGLIVGKGWIAGNGPSVGETHRALPAIAFANAPCAFASCRRAGSVPGRVLAGGGWCRGLQDRRCPPLRCRGGRSVFALPMAAATPRSIVPRLPSPDARLLASPGR